MIQSPASKRPKGPAQRESVDGLSETKIGRSEVGQQGPSGGNNPINPPGLKFTGGANAGGGAARSETVPVGSDANNSGGAPGAAKSEDAMRKGGTVERFSSDRGRNG